MQLSIVIVNYEVRTLLEGCLNSISSNLKGENHETVVVDNASADGSAETVRRGFPWVRLIVNDENYGFARACNQGIRICSGKYLLLLNPDSEVTEGTYDRIVNFMETHPQVGIGGCHLYYPDGRTQTCFHRFTSLANASSRALLLYFLLPRGKLTAPLFDDYLRPGEPIQRVCGGAMVLRREMLEEVGLFDESFFLYSEDEDLCYRAQNSGWKILAIPHTRVIHYHDQSGKKNIRKAIFSTYRSQFFLYRKYHAFPKTLLFRLIQLIGLFIRCTFWFFRTMTDGRRPEAKQRLAGYLSLLLSDYSYDRSFIEWVS